MKRRAAALLAALLLASACGKKGDPLPPLSSRPSRVTDLSVVQKDAAAEVSFSFPSLRVDGAPLRDLDRIEIYRIENPPSEMTAAAATTGARSDRAPISGERRKAEAARRRERSILEAARRAAIIGADALPSATLGGRIVFRDPLDAVLATSPPPTLGYAVVTVRRNGERSEISNIPTIAPVVPPAAPAGVLAEPEEKRICVAWHPVESTVSGSPADVAGYFVYRRTLAEAEFGKPLNTEAVAVPEYADGSAAYGSTYVYTVTAVPKDHPAVEGPPAIQFGLDYRDVYPPPAIAHLDALPEEHVVRLSWTPVEADDLAGYVVYRAEGDGNPVKLAERPAAETTYEDRAVSSDRTYRYAVRAVDRAGNLGAASPEVAARPFREE